MSELKFTITVDTTELDEHIKKIMCQYAPERKVIKMDEAKDRLLKISEAAEALGLSRTKIYQITESGELERVKLSNKAVRIRQSAIDKYIAERI